MTTLLERLLAAHRALDRAVARELRRRLPDQLQLTALKRRRLAMKDRIQRLSAA